MDRKMPLRQIRTGSRTRSRIRRMHLTPERILPQAAALVPEKGSSVSKEGKRTGTGKGFFGFKGRKEKDQRDQKIEELTDQVRRQMAEFDNFRKRTDREKATMFDMGKRDVIEQILPVVDSFERGLGDMKEESEDPFRQGMQKIYRQLTKALEELGVRTIEAVGKPFDPNFHNAVMHCEDESATAW